MSAVIRGARGMVATTSFNAGDVVQRLLPLPDHFDEHFNENIADPRIQWANVSANRVENRVLYARTCPINPSTEIIDRMLYARTCIELGDEITVAPYVSRGQWGRRPTQYTGFYNKYDENNDEKKGD